MNIIIASEHGLHIQDKTQAADAISLCWGTDGLLLTDNDVGHDFFRLESGVAGEFMQKLVNYGVKTAFVCPDPSAHGERFSELAFEHSTHTYVRFFRASQEAMDWLNSGARQ